LTSSPIACTFKHGKEKRPFATEKQRKGGKYRHIGCGYFRSYRQSDTGDEVRYIMTISRNTLLDFALGCFIFSTLVFAVLFFLK
jgi:hypothetical protein